MVHHRYTNNKNHYYIITIRHPYNAIISSILRVGLNINIETINNHTKEYLNSAEYIVKYDFTRDNNCVLIYENFLNNHDLILNKLELFLNEKYSIKLRNEIKSNLDINNIKKQIVDNGYTNFDMFDRKTHFHGKHIIEFNGNTDYREILNEQELSILKKNKILNLIIEKYYK